METEWFSYPNPSFGLPEALYEGFREYRLMGRRLTTGTDPDGQITDEMLAAEPPIHDDVKITATLFGQVQLVADAVDADGTRIVELLGAPADGGPPE